MSKVLWAPLEHRRNGSPNPHQRNARVGQHDEVGHCVVYHRANCSTMETPGWDKLCLCKEGGGRGSGGVERGQASLQFSSVGFCNYSDCSALCTVHVMCSLSPAVNSRPVWNQLGESSKEPLHAATAAPGAWIRLRVPMHSLPEDGSLVQPQRSVLTLFASLSCTRHFQLWSCSPLAYSACPAGVPASANSVCHPCTLPSDFLV